MGGDRIEAEPLRFHEGIRDAYLDLAGREPGRFVVIEASGGSAGVHDAVVARVGDWLLGWAVPGTSK